MAIELSKFLSRLNRSGIADAVQTAKWSRRFADAPRSTVGDDPPGDNKSSRDDAKLLAAYLVKSQRITRFQAKALLAVSTPTLRRGNYILRDPKAPAPFAKFVQAHRVSDRAVGLLLRIPSGNAWLVKHTAIRHPNLQPLQFDSSDGVDNVFSQIGSGKLLMHRMREKTFDVRLVAQLGKQIVSALACLHQQGVAHGAVRADRIWLSDDDHVPILLRSPGDTSDRSRHDGNTSHCDGAKENSTGGTQLTWLDVIDRPALYQAPETTRAAADAGGDDEAVPRSSLDRVDDLATLSSSPAADLYSLGCLLFRLATGQFPFQGSTNQDLHRSHREYVPEQIAEALRGGQRGDPLLRVLAHAMAKSPRSRFAHAAELENALDAVITTITTPTSILATVAVDKSSVAGSGETSSPHASSGSKVSGGATVVQTESIRASGTPALDTPVVVTPVSRRPANPRRRPRRRNKAPWVLAALAGVVVMQTLYLTLTDPVQPMVRKVEPFVAPVAIPSVSGNRYAFSSENASPSTSGRPASSPSALPRRGPQTTYQLSDDGRLLYVSPVQAKSLIADSVQSATKTIPLDILPPGPAMIISTRFAKVHASPVAQSILDAFTPELTTVMDAMTSRLKVPIDQLERVTTAIYPGANEALDVSLSVSLVQPQPIERLLEKWQVEPALTSDGHQIYAGNQPDDDAFYFPASQVASGQIQRFAIGPIDSIAELASIQGQSIPLPRSLASLWNTTSDQSAISVLSLSNFLFADGSTLLTNSIPEAFDPLNQLLVPSTSAILWVTDWDGVDAPAYSEVRLFASGSEPASLVAQKLGNSLDGLAGWADQFAATTTPDGRWAGLAGRLPAMIRYTTDRIRVGVDRDAAVANVYLPPLAVPQLSLATVLALNTSSSDISRADQEPSRKLTLVEILRHPISVSFAQESLEFAIDAVVDALARQLPSGTPTPTISIAGRDLQQMGITQNQQIRDFDKQATPLRQVLTDLVVAANPDKSAAGSSDQKQSLIWVTPEDSNDPDSEKSGNTSDVNDKQGVRIIITTRPAAADKDYPVPKEFIP